MRKTLLFSSVIAALSLGLNFASDWSQYRGPNHDGKSGEDLSKWPEGGPRALWKVPTPNGFSSFVVGGGRAFTLVGRNVDGANREVCLALDADSGKELWAVPIAMAKYDGGGDSGTPENSGGDGPRSTPSLDHDRVYTTSADLQLYCLNAADGKTLWRKDILKEFNGQLIGWKNAASPLIDGDLVFMAGGGAKQALLAFNKNDGSVVWKTQDDKMTHATPIVATIAGVRQIIFLTQTGLVSLNPTDGAILWRQKFDYRTSTAASPVVDGDIVYASAGYGVGAGAYQVTKEGDKFSSKELWRTPGKLPNHWSTPVAKDGYLYGIFGFKEYGNAPVKCVELKTGKEMWSQKGFGPGNVILVGNQLLALTDDGELVAIDPKPDAYKEVGRFQAITGKCWSTPAYANGRIYVRSTKEGACFGTSNKLSQR
jgi:outer membrane protein assembly factor BamB